VKNHVRVLLILSAPVLAAGSQQLDWSGGPGVPGPVTYWEESFGSSSQMSWRGVGGYLVLTFLSVMHWIHSGGPGCEEVVVVDTDGDGDLDVVGTQATWDRISHWENMDGHGGSWTRTIIADSVDSPYAISSSDIDGDGDADLATASLSGALWLENSGAGWIRHQIGATACWGIASGDIDSDGDIDLASCNWYGSDTKWYENVDGQGNSWTEHTISGTYHYATRVRIADLNSDGDMDVVIAKASVSQIVYFENTDGVGSSWEPRVICNTIFGSSGGAQVWALEIADLDKDGDIDVLTAASDPTPLGMAIWVENVTGDGLLWQKHSIDANLTGANGIAAADLDDDGDVDVAVCSGAKWGEKLEAWYENVDRDGIAWNLHDLGSAGIWPMDPEIADVDDDGSPEVLVSDLANGVRWYSFGRATSGWLESSILDPPGGSQLQWTDLSWDATVPPGTILTFQVRASDDPSNMGAWSPAFAVPGSIAPYLPDPAWYFQYRVNMVTGVPPVSPVLDKVLVQYDPVGIGGQPESSEPSLTVLSGNPSPGSVVLDVYLPEAGQASLRIYDIAGRLVEMPLSGQAESGHHQLTVTDLPTGCYRALMTTDGFSTEAELVILHR